MKVVAPHRVTHSYTQRLHGSPGEVFPLLCPVRECDWVNGWEPSLVISSSGVAELDCVFVTGSANDEAVWIITQFEPATRIEFIKINPRETAARITIDLRQDGAQTLAEVTYSYTALSADGDRILAAFTTGHYLRFMREWEGELNHYLRTRTKMPTQSAQ